MPKNYLIGIGGTGAKVIESVVQMCAAGYGPDELSIILVDPDSGNGNLNKTTSLIWAYNKCFEKVNSLRDRGFFKTKISVPNEQKDICWSIFDEKSNTTLESYVFYDTLKNGYPESNIVDLVDILFSEAELKEPLNKGFRGHPSIGSVVMSNPPKNKDPFQGLFNAIESQSKNYEVKIFLAGSIFGGTGAAGVPTFGADNLFMKIGKKEGENNSAVLGAALILPYFSFDNPSTETASKERMYVTNKDFPVATKAALEYYAEKELAFNQLYFIGDSVVQNVGKFSVGSITQKNSPHYIEIVAGLAAFDFFSKDFSEKKVEKKYFISARESQIINWKAFPISSNESEVEKLQSNFKLNVLTFTTFAYSFCSYGKKARQALNEMENKENYIKQPWYKKHGFDKIKEELKLETDIRYSTNKIILEDFDKFLLSFLTWICAVDADENIQLIDKKQIFLGNDNSQGAFKEENLFDPENKTNISNLLKADPPKTEKFSAFLNNGLNKIDLTDKSLNYAAQKFLLIFYNGSREFCKLNYNLK